MDIVEPKTIHDIVAPIGPVKGYIKLILPIGALLKAKL